MFEYAFDLSGCQYPVINEFPIATSTDVDKGEVIGLTEALVTEVDADNDDEILGVAAENHDGATEGQTGLTLKAYCSPSAIFKIKNTHEVVADSGNTTTLVDAS